MYMMSAASTNGLVEPLCLRGPAELKGPAVIGPQSPDFQGKLVQQGRGQGCKSSLKSGRGLHLVAHHTQVGVARTASPLSSVPNLKGRRKAIVTQTPVFQLEWGKVVL